MEQYDSDGDRVISSVPDPVKLEYGILAIVKAMSPHDTDRLPQFGQFVIEPLVEEVQMELVQIDLSSPPPEVILPEVERLTAAGFIAKQDNGRWITTEQGLERRDELNHELYPPPKDYQPEVGKVVGYYGDRTEAVILEDGTEGKGRQLTGDEFNAVQEAAGRRYFGLDS